MAGADEAGRGCLAGPLVAAAVAFDHSALSLADVRSLADLDDSKKRSEAQREQLFAAILNCAKAVAISIRPAEVIDRDGLHVSNLGALSEALGRVGRSDGVSISDGFAVALPWGTSDAIVGGDGRSAAIAAASIIAKVTRDRHMHAAALRWPGYGFESHVGYGTAAHIEAIEALGPTPLHRMSFNCRAYAAKAA